jgi:hypothetical protein
MEKKMKHMEMIQGVINRMASNSFVLKGWTVTLVAGIFALASKEADKMYFLVAYIPIIIFWGLDSYYLLQERLYRALYDKVRNMEEDTVDFSMNTSLREFKTERNSFGKCFISKTEVGFYFPLALLSAVIIIITHI